MICVTVLTDSQGRRVGVAMRGHAGCSEDYREGQELVCAAVSALTLNMANSVEHFTEDAFEAEEEEEAGSFDFRFTSGISAESKLLMDSFLLGLERLEDSYGEPYIKICFQEV